MERLRRRELSVMKRDELYYYCRFCQKSFISLGSRTDHERNIHKKHRPHSCDECGKKFYKKFNLALHKQKHCGSHPHSCKICGKKFKSTYSVKTHMKIHSNSRPFMCEICGKVFRTLAVLEAHNNMHTKQKHYSCCLCEKSYTYRASLFLHMRTHSGERPYQCKDCAASFIVKSHLTDHMKTHTGARPFGCKYCKACFARKISLKKHLKSHIRAGLKVDLEEALLHPQCKTECITVITSMGDKHSNSEKITKTMLNQTSKRIVLYKNFPLEVEELVTLVITLKENEESLHVSKIPSSCQKVITETDFDAQSYDIRNRETGGMKVIKSGQDSLPSFSTSPLEISEDQQSVFCVSNGHNTKTKIVRPKAILNHKNCSGIKDHSEGVSIESNQVSECVLEGDFSEFDNCQGNSQNTFKQDRHEDPYFSDLKNKKCQGQLSVTEHEETAVDTACGNCFLLKCKYCSKEFRQLIYLKTHIELHKEHQHKNTDQNISSEVLENQEGTGIDFTSSALPNSHLYNCDTCGRGFALRSELRKHTKIHSSKCKYFCQKCRNIFQTERFYKRHSCIMSDQFSVFRSHSLSKSDLINNLNNVTHNDINFEIGKAIEVSDISRNGNFDYCQPCRNYLLRELSTHCHWLPHLKNKPKKTNNFEVKDKISCDYSPLETAVPEKQRDNIKHSEGIVIMDRNILPVDITEDVKNVIRLEKVLSVPLDEYGMEVTVKTELQGRNQVEEQEVKREDLVTMKKCTYCPMSFKYKSALQTHERIHTGEKPFLCPICRKSFSKKSNMKMHQQTHTRNQKFLCDFCGKHFSYKSTLDTHKHIHTMELPFTCDVCGKGFRYESSRYVHMKRHMGVKPFKCDFCSKGFVSKIEMEDHKRIHTKEKPYQCEDCGRSYSHRHHLNNHLKVHTD